MLLKDYQAIAITELLERSKKLLNQPGVKKLIFRSSTGSGKTIIMAEFLKRMAEDPEVRTPFAFIWTAPRKLHTQSREKLISYFENSRAMECSEFEDLDDRQIQENEILFFNWESINKKDAIYIRENEKDNNLGAVIERTKDAGREIILIIDESHHHATSEISQNLIRDIAPKLTIEVSATPVVDDPDEIVSVPLEKVKAEGMIKKSIMLNPDFKNVLSGENIQSALADGADALVIETAIKKREELARGYDEAGVNINPLLLIQLPDRKTQMEDQMKADVTRILKDKYNITIKNGKLAIYLSGEKENLENIAKPTNETEVLIFKQAIALGWDCPRAQVLVLFRDWKSLTFSIQTVGRIMRMPEPDAGHYENELLNHSYVYTNLSDIAIREDIAKDYVTIYTSRRIDKYEPIKLASVHSKRQREKTRLAPLFINIFLTEAKKYGLEKKLKTNGQKVQMGFISDFQAGSVDELGGADIAADKSVDTKNDTDLQRLYDFFVRRNLSPFYPEDRSIGRVKESIYHFFRMRLGMHYTERFRDIINIVLSEDNVQHFVNVIDAAKESYITETQKRGNELEVDKTWEMPEAVNFGGNYTELASRLSVMQPFYYDHRWKPEKAFIAFMEKSKSIAWWFKNGDRDAVYFAVPYKETGEWHPFYVDFIVRFKDGRIGLFDTKSGRSIKDAREKSDGLQAYLKEHGKKNKLFGGIIANTDSQNFSGRWMVYTGSGTELAAGKFDNWEVLEV
ncbi:hypothetical protein A3I35_03030 [Candidatus Falkowbacteria bacterium RIFCSPLOWO2_02_FULL_45_15]|uniref:Helicase/UvrB N-terminal domain-containing protein n=1 Tax=Candidatus Falkowbacteria bacterium RIFCSPLOWO2_02_FULL_45_15 TaxID=1797988 RepID=A0A1F5RYL6_9BACT|nr:MAG: hypothetical protein A3I35_03030 [Candidatus Falkowbacteria bacterium RIFCSPLOWO2_02_FULL_45_15]